MRNKNIHDFLLYFTCFCLCEGFKENKTENIYLIRIGSYGNLKCSNSNPGQLQNISHKWTYHGKPEVNFNIGYDSLFVPEATARQTGKYICTEIIKNGTGGDNTIDHIHRLLVYKIPQVTLQIVQRYLTPKCVKPYDINAASDLEKLLCRSYPENCPFFVWHNCSAHKRKDNVNPEQMQGVVSFTINLSSKDFIVPQSCLNDVKCVRFKLAEYMDNIEKKPKNIWKQVLVRNTKRAKWYWRIPKSRTVTMLQNCSEGFIPYHDLVCVSCEPGQFYKDGVCNICPINTYQDEGGGIERCKSCPEGTVTTSTGASSLSQCQSNKQGKSVTGTSICTPGYFWYNGVCSPCPVNSFQDQSNKSTACKICNESFTETVGSTSLSGCNATAVVENNCQTWEYFYNGCCVPCRDNSFNSTKVKCQSNAGTSFNNSISCTDIHVVKKSLDTSNKRQVDITSPLNMVYIWPLIVTISITVTIFIAVGILFSGRLLYQRHIQVKKAKEYVRLFSRSY